MGEFREETRRERSGVEATRREGVGEGGGPVGTRREGLDGGYVRINLPRELEGRYVVVAELPSGGESDVLLVRRSDDGAGAARVLKLYRHGLEPDGEALAVIRGLPAEHVVPILDCGRSSAGWWEEQEYLEHGSLAELLLAEGPRLPAGRLREVVLELATALEAVHPVLHRDVKPTNVFVRSRRPLDLVLGDFGLARSTAFTHIVSTVAGSLAYQSPEALDGGASPARDWWAAGMIFAEAALGRHPFYDEALGWPGVAEMRIALTTRPVPLDGIEDERVRLLCRGLLVRDPRGRWGATEVRAWLDGVSPVVAAEPEAIAAAAAAISPFIFAGERHASPRDLAPSLAQHWDDALRLISGAASEAPEFVRLVGWLQDHNHQAALRVLEAGHDRSFARRLFRLLRALDPQLPPSFRGYLIDRQGLHELSQTAVHGDRPAATALHDILNLGILGELAREEEHGALISLEHAWRLQAELLRQLHDELGPVGETLGDESVQRIAHAQILLALLDTDAHDQLATLTQGAEAEAALQENSDLRTLFLRTRGSGDEPARLIAATLIRDAALDALPRIRADRQAAEEAGAARSSSPDRRRRPSRPRRVRRRPGRCGGHRPRRRASARATAGGSPPRLRASLASLLPPSCSGGERRRGLGRGHGGDEALRLLEDRQPDVGRKPRAEPERLHLVADDALVAEAKLDDVVEQLRDRRRLHERDLARDELGERLPVDPVVHLLFLLPLLV